MKPAMIPPRYREPPQARVVAEGPPIRCQEPINAFPVIGAVGTPGHESVT